LQRPHLAARGSLPSGVRLAAPQAGQTNWRMAQPLILRRPITSRAIFS